MTTIRDVPDQQRFELLDDGALAAIEEYRLADGVLSLVHTETMPGFEGRGLAGQIVRFALAEARARGLAVLPECAYVRKVVADHPDLYVDLVPAAERVRFDLPAE